MYIQAAFGAFNKPFYAYNNQAFVQQAHVNQGDSFTSSSPESTSAVHQNIKFGKLGMRRSEHGLAVDGTDEVIPFPPVVDGLSKRTLAQAASILELGTLMDHRTPFVRGVHPTVGYPYTDLDGAFTYTNRYDHDVTIETVVPGYCHALGLDELQTTVSGMRRTFGYAARQTRAGDFAVLPLVKPALKVTIRQPNAMYTSFTIDPSYPEPQIILPTRFMQLKTNFPKVKLNKFISGETIELNENAIPFIDPESGELSLMRVQPFGVHRKQDIEACIREVFDTLPEGLQKVYQEERGAHRLNISVSGTEYTYTDPQLRSLATQYRMNLGVFKPDDLTVFAHRA